MFEIVEKKGQIVIRLTAGDSAEIETSPFIDADSNKIFDIDSNDKPIILGDNDYVLFCVASPSNRIYLKRILTKDDYNDDGILTMKFYPNDTIDMQPYNYNFSFSYMPNNGDDCYTYVTGIFSLLPAIGTVRDLHENNIIDEPELPDESDDTNNSSESGDNNGD
jgi:hypothetical protein